MYIYDNLNVRIDTVHCWSDSSVVLHWIWSEDRKWKPFVQNRVGDIRRRTEPACWRHVATEQNPADCLTTGVTAREIFGLAKWWQGPSGLRCKPADWPTNAATEWAEDGELEADLQVTVAISQATIEDSVIDIERYSSLIKLLRVTAWICRAVDTLRGKNGTRFLTVEETAPM